MGEYILKKSETSKKIKDSFMEIYKVKDYSQITVREICLKANIHRGTFYRYFQSIDDLLRIIENELLEKISPPNKLNIKKTRFDSVIEIKAFLKESLISQYKIEYELREHLNILLGPNGDLYFINRFEKEIEMAIREFSEILLKKKNKEYIIHYLSGGIVRTVMHWLSNPDISVEELAEIFATMFCECPYIKSK